MDICYWCPQETGRMVFELQFTLKPDSLRLNRTAAIVIQSLFASLFLVY